jgi:hypothetical protein
MLFPRQRCAFLLAALLCIGAETKADVIIAEFDAINIGSATDGDGDQADWIEIRNSGATAVDLIGWALSDDPAVPGKWVFPTVTVAANSQLLVYASGKDRAIAGVQLHTNFKLGESGSIVLSQPDGAGGWTAGAFVAELSAAATGSILWPGELHSRWHRRLFRNPDRERDQWAGRRDQLCRRHKFQSLIEGCMTCRST